MREESIQVVTLGCSKNTVDTEHLLYQVRNSLRILPSDNTEEYASYLLFNTCGFIGDAKEESLNAVLEGCRRKAEGKVGKVIVFGCLSQRYANELPSLIPEVDCWCGARDLDEVAGALGVTPDKTVGRINTEGRPGTAYLKISEGCDRRCSYCAIPLIRGAHRSVPVEHLLMEAEFLAAKGVRELILIAQDTTYYGLDIYGRRSLGRLMESLSSVEGIEWIRIHYSYPSDFPEDVLDIMASNPKICPYIDIPLQHISDSVLKRMRRGIDSITTRDIICRIRSRVPGVMLRTTMIVGHPGEGEEEFDELMDFVREARFERLGAFAYSEEEGTYGASHYKDDVPEDIKKERLDILMSAQAGISLEINRGRIGDVERVMVDSFTDGVLVCRSRYESPDVDGEIIVRPTSGMEPSRLVGKFITVRISGADQYDLTAEPICCP